MKRQYRIRAVAALLALMVANVVNLLHADEAGKPLKVYILAGQSNMQGHAKVETFDYIGDDSNTAALLSEMVGTDGKPRVCERVWISYLTGSRDGNGEGTGKLTAGYGARSNPTEDGGKIGPEFTFGLTIQKACKGPVLLIKTAWGGKSLHTDFRPPSAGPYEFTESQLDNFKKQGKDVEALKAEKAKATGHYYRLMTDHVKEVLSDIKRVYPDYDPQQGYELAGFVWFQGWNDMVDSGTYPNRGEPGGYSKYSQWMADFIRDVRKDLNAPTMPFVIGVMGVGGIQSEPNYFRQAMAAPADLPEFQGNVVAVQTAPYWDQTLADIERKFGRPQKISYYLRKGGVPARVVADNYPIAYAMRKDFWDTPAEDRKMTPEEQRAYVSEYRAKLISPEEEAMWKRGASNAGYHYLGSAKTMAQIGEAFAQALLTLPAESASEGATNIAPVKHLIDTHIHLYDTTRDVAITWPRKDDNVLYKPHLPAEYSKIAKAVGVTGVVVVEASNNFDDNRWVLDQVADDDFYIGLVGNVDVTSEDFEQQLQQLQQDRRLVGVRPRGKQAIDYSDKVVLANLAILAKHGLTMDYLTNSGGIPGIVAIDQVARKIPDLRIVVNHCLGYDFDGNPPSAEWVSAVEHLAANRNVSCKISGLYQRSVPQPAPQNIDHYRSVLDVLWDNFGKQRLIYGSNWPVTKHTGSYASYLSLVDRFLSEKGQDAREHYYWKNATDAYRLPLK